MEHVAHENLKGLCCLEAMSPRLPMALIIKCTSVAPSDGLLPLGTLQRVGDGDLLLAEGVSGI